MTALLPIILFTGIAAITPGPNNIIVMASASAGGARAASVAIAAIVGSSAALFLLCWKLAALLPAPEQARWIATGGAVLLAGLAAKMFFSAGDEPARVQPIGGLAAAGLQMLNPKAWIMLVTIAAAARTAAIPPLALTAILCAIWAASLSLWAFAGAVLQRAWPARIPAHRLDQAMAALLLAFAVWLPFSIG